MAIVKLQSGEELEFDNKYSDEQITQAVNEYLSQRQSSQPQDTQQPPQAPIPQEQPQQPIGRAEAGFTTLTNAVPFAPRIKAAIAAAYAKPQLLAQNINPNEPNSLEQARKRTPSFSDLYDEAFSNEIGKLNQARSQYPAQSLATEVVGGLPIAVKGLKTAVALGAAQAAGESKDLRDVKDVVQNAGLAGALSGATYGAGKLIGKGYEKFVGGVKAPKTTADDIRTMATNAYQEAENKGGTLKSGFINKIIDDAHRLDKQTSIGKMVAGQTPISEVKKSLVSFQDQPTSLQSLQELDEALGDKIDSLTENGRILKEGLPLLKLQNSLRNLVDNANPSMIEGGKEGFEALKRGRELWAKSAKLRDVERIITKAELSDNPATTIKTGFRTLYTNGNKLKQYTPDERELIKKAAQSGFVSDSLRTLGSRLIPIGSIIAGGGLPSTMAAIASSTGSRNLASRAQLIKTEKLAEAIIAGKVPMPKKSDSRLNSSIAQRIGALGASANSRESQ